MAKSNRLIQEDPATDTKKASAGKSAPKDKQGGFKKIDFSGRFNEQKVRRISGSILILFASFFLLAYTSYFFTWQNDQDMVMGKGFFQYLFESDSPEVENWLGKMGAWMSHYFVYRWFGVSTIFIGLLSFVLGVKLLFKVSLIELRRAIPILLVALPYFSVLLGFFTATTSNLGGSFGFEINHWLKTSFGVFGAFLFVLTLGFILVVTFFNPDFKRLMDFFARSKTAAFEDDYLKPDDLKMTNTLRQEDIEKDDEALEVDFDEDDLSDEELEAMEMKVLPKETAPEITQETEREPELIDDFDKDTFGSDEDFDVEVAPEEEALSAEDIDDKVKEFGTYDPKLDLSGYVLPSIDLLNDYGNKQIQIDKEELELNKNRIVDTLKNYNIEIDKIKATVGPTVTLYEIIPAPGVRISKIKNLEDDIALSLSALGIRIIAPIPGKGTIGIEVPNSKPEMVSMRSLIASEKFQNADMDLPIVLGKSITNETLVFDLAKMPHLLVAGATGQGKSVGLNAIMVSILYKKHPAQVKFVLVDPKKVELTLYNKIERHFLAKLPDEADAIITDTSKVVATLNSLCIEMDERYELLKEAQVRTIKEYNQKFINRKLNPEKGHRFMPYIVVLIDEFADLIMTAGKEVEHPIARLAQLARAIGIHLIVATQRPSVNVITGMIKANFPARIAFRVLSKIDSRTILDSSGADQLIGRGDMLISTGSDLVRLQCGFVDTPEVEAICDFIGEQRGYPSAFLLPEYVGESAENLELDIDDLDSMFVDSARIVVIHQQGSASLLQRKLKLGFNRAGRIIDQLEAHGIIGPSKGSKAREVLISDEIHLDDYLRSKDLL
jgi:DNA segregation ATPase FtsK/SpoIIIE, S-DNA-T family